MEPSSFEVERFFSYKAKKQAVQKSLLDRLDQRFGCLDPYDSFYSVWRVIMTFFIIYFFFEMPLAVFFTHLTSIITQTMITSAITFDQSIVYEYERDIGTIQIAYILAVLVFFLDILISLNLGFYEGGIFVSKRAHILPRYLGKGFITDLIGLVVVLISYFSYNYVSNVIKGLFFAQVVTLSRFDEDFMFKLKAKRIARLCYKFTRLILILVWYTHVLACIFFFIDYQLYLDNYDGYVDKGYLWLTDAPAMPDIVTQYSWGGRYLYAFYWSIDTVATVGYGDMFPMNPFENLYLLLVILNICVLFGYFVNNVFAILAEYHQVSDKLSKQLSIMNFYFEKRKVQKSLRFKIRKYMEFIIHQQGERDIDAEQEIVSKFSEAAARRVRYEQYKAFINYLPLDLSLETRMRLAAKVSTATHFEQELVCNNFEEVSMLEKGRLIEFYQMAHAQHYVSKLVKPDVVHMYEFFSGCASYKLYKSREYTELLGLAFKDFYQILDDAEKERFHMLRNELRVTQNTALIKQDCTICKCTHFEDVCYKLHLVIQAETINKSKGWDNLRMPSFKRDQVRQRFKADAEEGLLKVKQRLVFQQVEAMDSMHSFQDYYPEFNGIRLEDRSFRRGTYAASFRTYRS